MGQRSVGDDPVGPFSFSLNEFLGWFSVSIGKMSRFGVRPGQVWIPVLRISFALTFPVAQIFGVDETKLRSKIANLFKSGDVSDLVHDRQGQDLADAPHRLQHPKLIPEPCTR